MKVWININAAAAVKAGKAISGVRSVDLTEEQIASLSTEEREVLATLPGLGKDRLSDYDKPWGYEHGLSAPTFDEVRRGLALEVAAREAQRRAFDEETSKAVRTKLDDLRRVVDTPFNVTYVLNGVSDRHFTSFGRTIPWPDDVRKEVSELIKRAEAAHSAHLKAKEVEQADAIRRSIAEMDAAGNLNDLIMSKYPDIVADEIRAYNTRAAARRAAKKEADTQAEQQRAESYATGVRAWGRPDQIERLEAGVLPHEEGLALIRETLFAPLADLPRYRAIAKSEIKGHGEEPVFKAWDETDWSAEQWKALREIQLRAQSATKAGNGLADEVTVVGRGHAGGVNSEDGWQVTRWSAKVTLMWGGWAMTREYALPDAADIDD